MAVIQMHQRRRRTYAGEEEWLGLFEELGHARMRRGFIGVGVSPQVAGGLVWFLEDQLTLDRTQNAATRVRYRRVLAELDPEKVREEANRAKGAYLRSPRPALCA